MPPIFHALSTSLWDGCEIVVFDKAYVDFNHLHILHERGVFWVTRAKDNMAYEIVGQHPTRRRCAQLRIKRICPGS